MSDAAQEFGGVLKADEWRGPRYEARSSFSFPLRPPRAMAACATATIARSAGPAVDRLKFPTLPIQARVEPSRDETHLLNGAEAGVVEAAGVGRAQLVKGHGVCEARDAQAAHRCPVQAGERHALDLQWGGRGAWVEWGTPGRKGVGLLRGRQRGGAKAGVGNVARNKGLRFYKRGRGDVEDEE